MKFPKQTQAQKLKSGEESSDASASGSLQEKSRSQLFRPAAATGKYMHQKLLRLSPVYRRDKSTKRIGAIASRDGEASEIAFFDATTQVPEQSFTRIEHGDGEDTVDMDLIEPDEGSFCLAYCTNSAVFIHTFDYNFSTKSYDTTSDETVRIYSRPTDQRGIELRCLRWLNHLHLLVASNNRSSKFSELLILTLDHRSSKASITHRTRLPSMTKNINTLDICKLDPDPATGERQILAAAAGSDGSIHLYSLNHKPSTTKATAAAQITSPRLFTTLRSVHADNGICALRFANFFPPIQPPGSNMSVASAPAYVRLASVAVFADTVVVETIALTSVPTAPHNTADVPGRQQRDIGAPAVRWVLSSRAAERMFSWANLVLVAFVVLMSAVVAQGYLNLSGVDGGGGTALAPLWRLKEQFAHLQAPGAIPPGARSAIELSAERLEKVREREQEQGGGVDAVRAAVEKAEQAVPPEQDTADAKVSSLRQLVGHDAEGGEESGAARKTVLVRPHHEDGEQVAVSMHEEEGIVEGAKKFDELTHEEKERWKGRLVKAGQWTLDEGEAVLKGVLFSEYAAVVGGGLRDAVLNH